jgi:hypothetical protein
MSKNLKRDGNREAPVGARRETAYNQVGEGLFLSAIRFRVHGLRLVEKEKIEADGWKLIAES